MNLGPPLLDEVEEQHYGAGPDRIPRPLMDGLFEPLFEGSLEPLPHDDRENIANAFGSLRSPVTDDNQPSGNDATNYMSYEEWQRSLTEVRQKLSPFWPRWEEMQKISADVRDILQGLRNREQELLENNESLLKMENRVGFLVSALEEFIDGNDGLRYRYDNVASLMATDWDNLEDSARVVAEMEVLSTLLTCNAAQRVQDPINAWNIDAGICEIISSTIYEVLNLFNFDITLAQVPINAHRTTYFNLLKELCEQIEKENRKLRLPETNRKFPREKSKNDASPYEYSSAFRTRDIRLLKILPGTGDDQIKCRLEVHGLDECVIPEVLSYVWGSQNQEREKILVDEKDFHVLANLHGILQALRKTSTTRTIWIDAICINQADEQEKGHQVRLMREIYSKTKSTTIWLGDSNQTQDHSFGTADWFTPLPPRFGGYDIDGNDLVAIIDECSKIRMDEEWDEKQWVIYTMLHRCLAQIQLNEWWKRVWTLQEAAIPSKAPNLLFKGRLISFDTLITGESILLKLRSLGDHYHKGVTRAMSVMGDEVAYATCRLAFSQPGIVDEVPLLMRYRHGLGEDQRGPELKTFTAMLYFTDVFKATNPLDNIFALGSLLPKYSEKLIKVDYTEHYSDVFKRATARSFNSDDQLRLMGNFNFLFETASKREKSQEKPHVPSWVLDLTYSNARLCGNRPLRKSTERVTVDGFIFGHRVPSIAFEGGADAVCFTTPITLFCTGCYIDKIYRGYEIPSVGDDDPIRSLMKFLPRIYIAREQLRKKPIPKDIRERASRRGSEERKLLFSLLLFFSLQREGEVLEGDKDELIKLRNREAAGKPAIVTKTGLIGIGTAPVRQGDYLCWVHGAPVYLILRRVGNLDGVEKHRIIARVALFEALPDMTKRIESLKMRRFQIV